MTRQILILLTCLLVMCVAGSAAPTVIASALPQSGMVSGVAGSTVGWGYSITNNDAALWVAANGLNTSSAFTNGVFDSSIFDFPVIAPGATVQETYLPGTSGLAQFTFDSGAPLSTVNAGLFELSLAWYTEDPDACSFSCLYTGSAQRQATAPYRVSLTTGAAVPEPSTAGILLSGLAVCNALKRRVERSEPPTEEKARA